MMRSKSSRKGLFTIFLFYFSTDDETYNPMIARNSLRDFQYDIAEPVRSFSFVFLLCFCVVFPKKCTFWPNFQHFITKRHHFTPLFTTNIITEPEVKCNREQKKILSFVYKSIRHIRVEWIPFDRLKDKMHFLCF